MRKISVHIIDGQNSGNESEAVRQVLEYFGAQVKRTLVGRPNDLMEALENNTSEFVVLCLHGEDGKMLLPELSPDLYLPGELIGPVESEDLQKLLACRCKLLINTGCGLFSLDWSRLWIEKGAGNFIGAHRAVDGNAALQFLLRVFYEIIQNDRSINAAYTLAKGLDAETELFKIASKAST